MTIDLSDDETAALTRLLTNTIDADRYPLSPRIQTLKAILAKIRPEPVHEQLPPRRGNAPPRGSPGARSIGYGLWLRRLQPFEDGLQRLYLRRLRLQVEIDEPAQRRDQDSTFVIGKV
jgi:hypothetical protein